MHHSDILEALQNLTNEKPTQQKLADILGEKIGTIGARAMRNSKYSFEEIQKIGDFYNVDLLQNCIKSSLINSYHGQGKSIELKCAEASCGSGIFNFDTELIDNYNQANKYSFIWAKGDSMETTISNGSFCVVENQGNNNIIDNEIYFFSYEDNYFIKRLAHNINTVIITSDNKKYDNVILAGDELGKLHIYGRIVACLKKF